MVEIVAGDPLILTDAENLSQNGLFAGMTGECASIVSIEGDETYIFFMPDGIKGAYALRASRFTLDKERKEALLSELLDNLHYNEEEDVIQ